LQDAAVNHAADLCALTGSTSKECSVEFKDIGVATPTVTSYRRPQTRPQAWNEEPLTGDNDQIFVVLAVVACCAIILPLACRLCKKRSSGKAAESEAAEHERKVQGYLQEVASDKAIEMEEGKSIDDKAAVDEDTSSTITPTSDKDTEPSICDGIDLKSDDKTSNPLA
jgi:hypothetical protein